MGERRRFEPTRPRLPRRVTFASCYWVSRSQEPELLFQRVGEFETRPRPAAALIREEATEEAPSRPLGHGTCESRILLDAIAPLVEPSRRQQHQSRCSGARNTE